MTLAEYMRELVLMRRQYGQEEELYPLINMLLRENNQMKELSLRTVANGRIIKTLNKNTIDSAMLYGYASFPDLVILSQNCDLIFNGEVEHSNQADEMYGCIEAKGDNKDLIEFGYGEDLTLSNITLKYNAIIGYGSGRWVNKKRKTIKIDCANACKHEDIFNYFSSYKEVDKIDVEKEKEKGYDFSFLKDKKGVNRIQEIIFANDIKKVNKLKDLQDEEGKKRISLLIQEIMECKIGKYTLDDAKDEGLSQLIGELLWYGKVLYTNGIVWKYLKIENEDRKGIRNILEKQKLVGKRSTDWIRTLANENKSINVSCEEIGNLSNIYEEIKEKPVGEIQNEIENHSEWKKEWNTFINSLKNITWKPEHVHSELS